MGIATISLTRASIALLLMMGCGSPQHKPVTVEISGSIDASQAKSICDLKNANARIMPQYLAGCSEDGPLMSARAESAFRSAVVSNPACTGVVILNNSTDKALEDADWRMSISIAVTKDGYLDLSHSVWSIQTLKHGGEYVQGDFADTFQAATAVCTAAKGGGGKLR